MKKNTNKTRVLIAVIVSFCAGAYSFSTFQNPDLQVNNTLESPVGQKLPMRNADVKQTLCIGYTSDRGHSFVIHTRFPEREVRIKLSAFNKLSNKHFIKPKF